MKKNKYKNKHKKLNRKYNVSNKSKAEIQKLQLLESKKATKVSKKEEIKNTETQEKQPIVENTQKNHTTKENSNTFVVENAQKEQEQNNNKKYKDAFDDLEIISIEEEENEKQDLKLLNLALDEIETKQIDNSSNVKSTQEKNSEVKNKKSNNRWLKRRIFQRNNRIYFSISQKTLKIVASILIIALLIGVIGEIVIHKNNQIKADELAKKLPTISVAEKTPIEEEEILVTINGVDISQEEYLYYLAQTKLSHDSGDNSYWFGEDYYVSANGATPDFENDKVFLEVEEETLETLKKVVAIKMLCEENEIEVDENEIDDYIKTNVLGNLTQEEYAQKLKESNLTETLYRKIVKYRLSETKLIQKLYGDEIRKNLNTSKIVRFKDILITYNDEVVDSNDITQEIKQVIDENLNGEIIKKAILEKDATIYEQPDEKSNILNVALKGEEIIIEDITEDEQWLIVSYDDNIAYVLNQDIEIIEEIINTSSKEDEQALEVSSKIAKDENVVKQLSKQEAFDLINNIKKQLDDGENFEKLMFQYTEDAFMISNNEGYIVTVENPNTSSILEQTALALAENEHSDVIETNFGFYIICKYPIDMDYINENIEDYASDKIWKKYETLINEKIEKMKIDKKPNYNLAFINYFIDAYQEYNQN